MFDALFSGLASLVAFYYDLVPSFTFAIVMLTLTVMAVTTPLTWKSTRGMLALQRFQPEMKKLQAEHKGDRQALNEAMMAFYKEHKINPLGGCIPMLFQAPIFFVLYQVINGLTNTRDGQASPKHLNHSSELYERLIDTGGRMLEFGVDLSKTASSKGLDPGQRFPLYLMVGATVITQFIQTKRMSSRNSQAGSNPQMQMMNRVVPVFFGFISLSMPGGVIVYFIVSNLFRIAQQELMYRVDPTLSQHQANEREKIKEAKATKIEAGPSRSRPRNTSPAASAAGNGRGSTRNDGSRSAKAPAPSGRTTTKGGHGRATPKRPKKGRR